MNKQDDHGTTLIPTNYPDTLQSVIKYTIHFLYLLRWKEDGTYRHQSSLLLLLWTIFCLHSRFCILYAFPLITMSILLYYRHYRTNNILSNKKETAPESYEQLMTDLKQLQQELSLTLEDYHRLSLSVRNRRIGGQRWLSYIFFSVVFYSVWRWTLLVIGLDKSIWFIGCFIFGWQSPFMKIIRHAAQNQALVSLFVHAKNIVSQPCNSTLMKVTKHDHECMQRYYQFKVIEHQRWWLHKGWSSLLLKNERPSWSDEYLEKVPCIQEFRLPPPITKTTETFRWEWVTAEWKVDQQRNVDQEGWEYGIWGWNAWTSQSSGLRSYTRRRHWTRNARLIVETKVEDDVVQPELEALSADKETMSSAPISVTTEHIRPSSSNSTVSSTFTVPSLLSTSFSTLSSEEEEPLSPTVSTSLDHGNGFLYTKPLSTSSSTPTTERFKHHQRKVKRSFSEHSSMETHFWLHR